MYRTIAAKEMRVARRPPEEVVARARKLLGDFYSEEPKTLEKALKYIEMVFESPRPTPDDIGKLALNDDERIHTAWICIAVGYPTNVWL